MTDEFVRINIAFMPPADVAGEVARLSMEIGDKEESCFVIDNQNFYPHITIYGVEFPAHNLERVLSDVEELAKNLLAIQFKFKKVATEEGYIGIECEGTEEIANTQKAIIEKLNSLREGHIREKDRKQNMELSERDRNIQKYGHPDIMSLYKPHVTIIRLQDKQVAQRVAAEIKWPTKEFTLDRIGAFRMGPNGTCVELIKEFKLEVS